MAHIFVELIITLGALVYTALSIFEIISIMRYTRYTGIVDFVILTALCAIVSYVSLRKPPFFYYLRVRANRLISVIHAILTVRAFKNLAAKNKGEANYSV
jgi:hypothetical protein